MKKLYIYIYGLCGNAKYGGDMIWASMKMCSKN